MAKHLDFKNVIVGKRVMNVATEKARLVELKAITEPTASNRAEVAVQLAKVDDIVEKIKSLEATAAYLTTAGHTALAAKYTGIADAMKAVLTELEAAVTALDAEIV